MPAAGAILKTTGKKQTPIFAAHTIKVKRQVVSRYGIISR